MSTSSTTAPPRLGNILVQRGYLALDQLQAALDAQRQGSGKLLGEILIERGICTDDQVMECLAVVYGVPYAKLDPRISDPRAVEVLPREYIEKNLVFPLFKVRESLTVAVTEKAARVATAPAKGARKAAKPRAQGGAAKTASKAPARGKKATA